ncbi:MAG: hypothetical protein LBH81_02345 [Rickettsiales bacterium]|jgi:hypothetical protein|nr:hypothetical protein [Rickettsiales bacterium]
MPALAARFLPLLIKPLVWFGAILAVLYYYSASISGESLASVSLPDFLKQIGVCDAAGKCDIAAAGCIFCPYIRDLIDAVGNASAGVYEAFIGHIWIMLVLGFGIFAALSAWKILKEAAAQTADISAPGEKSLDIKPWITGLWQQAVRILVVGVFLGALGTLGNSAPRMLTDMTIRPILSIGAFISMKTAGLPSGLCESAAPSEEDKYSLITESATRPLMCMAGVVNTIALLGANKGFATMNQGSRDNKPLLWFLGLAAAAVFAIYGLKIFFELMNIVFTVLFFIMFLPVVIGALAFSKTWKLAGNVADNMLNQITSMAVGMVAIALKLSIFYALMSYAIDRNEGDPFAAVATLLFVFVFYYYVVEAKLMKQFANIEAKPFMNFGDNAYAALKGGVDWVGKAFTNLTKFGIGKTGGTP